MDASHYNFRLFAIFVPKIIRVGVNMIKRILLVFESQCRVVKQNVIMSNVNRPT